MKKFIGILILLSLFISNIYSQIQVSSPQKVAVGEQFRLQYTVSTTDVKSFRAGNIPDAFEVLMGPSTSTQQSFTMINGQTKSSSSVTYTYILCATKNGTFTIPGAHAKVDGKEATSQSVKITVSGKAQSNNSQGNQGSSSSRPGANVRPSGSSISGNDLFIKVSSNKNRVREQEPILLTYKVYTQVELTQLEGKMPDLTGFHTQEVQLPQQKSFHIESINGRPYRCVTWSQYVMYPQMTGKLEIPSITFNGIVVQENTNVDPFEAFFNGGSGYIEVKKQIKAPGVTLQVDPLPAKPNNFSGGVGKFSISAKADKTTVKSGNPVNITIAINGTGNLKLIKQPELAVPNDFEKYDAKVSDKTQLTSQGLSGSMIYDILVVPRNKGTYQIPPVELTYFDINAGKYQTIKTETITLNVEQGDGSAVSIADYNNKEDNDIHSIHRGKVEESSLANTFFGSVTYIILNALTILTFIVLLIIFRKRAMELANITQLKGKKANKVASKRLKTAAKLMSSGNTGDFYDEVLRALWGYVSDKLSIPVSDLSRENINEQLSTRYVDSNIIASFIEAIDECEFQRYAPGDSAGNMQKTYDKAVFAITNIEDYMKEKKNGRKKSAMLIIIAALLALSNTTANAETSGNDSQSIGLQEKLNADDAYSKGNYQQSIQIYEALQKNIQSADIYYNLGNAYYRTDNITQAVINYERALLLSPGNRDIKHNLAIAYSKTTDKIQKSDGIFIITWYETLLGCLSIDSWAYMAMWSLILSLTLFLIYLFVENILIRQVSFFASIIFMLSFVIGNLMAWQLKHNAQNATGAVIIAEEVSVKKTPTHDAAESFAAHEGTYVEIKDDALKGWIQVAFNDGREGWISANTVEKIVK